MDSRAQPRGKRTLHHWGMQATLHAFHEDTLVGAKRLSVIRHLEGCPACRQYFRQRVDAERLLKTACPEPETLTACAADAVLARALAEAGVEAPWQEPIHRHPLRRAAIPALIAGISLAWLCLPPFFRHASPPHQRDSGVPFLAERPQPGAWRPVRRPRQTTLSEERHPRPVQVARAAPGGAITRRRSQGGLVKRHGPSHPLRALRNEWRLADAPAAPGQTANLAAVSEERVPPAQAPPAVRPRPRLFLIVSTVPPRLLVTVRREKDPTASSAQAAAFQPDGQGGGRWQECSVTETESGQTISRYQQAAQWPGRRVAFLTVQTTTQSTKADPALGGSDLADSDTTANPINTEAAP